MKMGGSKELEIHTITTPFVRNTSVNCYLIRNSNGFILIDTGTTGKRDMIKKELENAGCQPGNLINYPHSRGF